MITFYELRVAYIAVGVILLFFAQHIRQLVINKGQSLKKVIMPFVQLGLVLITPFILNFYWIYASYASKTTYMMPGYNLSGVVNALSYYKLKHCLAVYLPWWPPGSTGIQKIGLGYFLVPVLVFMAIFFLPKNKNTRILTLLAVISIIFTAGSNPPFGKLYIWLFKHFPGFDAFRDPGKFFMLISLAYAPLLGISVDAIASKLKKIRFGRVSKSFKIKHLNIIFLLATFFILISLIWPAMTGKLNGAFTSDRMPEEYKKIEEFIKNQPDSFRTFWRPHVGKYPFYSFKYPFFSAGHTSYTPTQVPTRYFFGAQWGDGNVFSRSDYIAKILGILNVKYCFIPREDNLISWLGRDKDFYLSTYQNKVGLKKIEISENIFTFENKYFVPRIFAVNQSSLVVGSKKFLLDIAGFKDVDISSFAVFFSTEQNFLNRKLLKTANSVVFYDLAASDLVLNSVSEKYRFDLTKYATRADEAILDRWTNISVPPADTFGYLYGAMTQNPNGAIFDQNGFDCELVNPIELKVEKSGIFDVWIRAMKGPDMGSLSIWSLKSKNMSNLRNYILKDKDLKDNNFYFQWIKAEPVFLDKGKNYFGIVNKNGRGMLDQLIVIPQKNVEVLSSEISNVLKSKDIVIFKNCDSSAVNIPIPTNGKYQIIAQIVNENHSGNLDIFVNDILIKSLTLDQKEKSYSEFAEAYFRKGVNRIFLSKQGEGKIKLQKLILYKTDESIDSIEELFGKGERIPVEWKMINPTKFKAKLNTKKPAFLVFSEGFDPRWTLNLESPVRALKTYSMVNSFFINKQGVTDAILEFSPQRYIYKGLWISGIGFVFICSCLFFTGVRSLKKKKIIIRKKQSKTKQKIK